MSTIDGEIANIVGRFWSEKKNIGYFRYLYYANKIDTQVSTKLTTMSVAAYCTLEIANLTVTPP